MSTTVVIPATEHLVRTVLRFLEPAVHDYSSSAVVFQGKRPAHFLRKELAGRHGSACIPPHIFSFESLTDYVYTTLDGPVEAEATPLDAVGLLYDLHLSMTDRIGGEKFNRLDAFLPLGLRLYDALEELSMHEVSPEGLRAALPLSQLPNAERLSGLFEAFYERLRASGHQTRAMRLGFVAERVADIDLSRFGRIVVAGFYSFAPLERVLVRFLRSCDQAVFIYQEGPGLARRLQEVGDATPIPPPAMARPSLHFYKAGGTHAEVFALNHVLQKYLEQGTPLDERTVVVLPSADALFPVAQWTLPLVPGQNYNVSLGYPAGRTPTFGFISSLLQMITSMDRGRVYGPDYIAFMLHPYAKNVLCDGKPETTRILVHAIEEALASGSGAAFIRLERIEQDEILLNAVAGRTTAPVLTSSRVAGHLRLLHDTFIRRLLGAQSLGSFARSLIEILTFIDDHSTVRRHEFFRPFAVALLEQLNLLASSRLAAYRDDDLTPYCTITLRWLREASVPFPGTPVQGLQVLGLLETRNLQFERVCILDCNDDVLPGSPDIDPLLPPPVRLALHLPMPEERAALIEYHSAVLLGGAAESHLLYQEGGKKERSRVIERLFWEKERREGKLLGDASVTPILFNVNLANHRPDPIAKTPAMNGALESRTLTASALDTYMACPLRFYYACLLGLREKRQVEADMDAAGIGTLVHEVLKTLDIGRCGRRLKAEEPAASELQSAIGTVFAAHFGGDVSAAQILVREQIEFQVGRYLSWYRQEVLVRDEVTLVGLEVPLSGQFDGRRFTGQADRIERRGDRTVIIDYKTGGDEKRYRINVGRVDPEDSSTWASSIRSFQLPLYLIMLGSSTGEAIGGIDPMYVLLGHSARPMHPELPLFDAGPARGEQWDKITRTLSGVLEGLFDPGRPYAAPEDLSGCCPGCSFRSICGTGWVRGAG